MHSLKYAAYPQTLSLGFKGSRLDYSASSSKVLGLPSLYGSSRPTHLSYSFLVHLLAKPRANSPISYAFRVIWLCQQVFLVRILLSNHPNAPIFQKTIKRAMAVATYFVHNRS